MSASDKCAGSQPIFYEIRGKVGAKRTDDTPVRTNNVPQDMLEMAVPNQEAINRLMGEKWTSNT